MTALLRTFALLGLLLFGGLLLLSWVAPMQIERQARDFIRLELEQQLSSRLAEPPPALLDRALGLIGGQQARLDALRTQVREQLPRSVDALIARMQQPDCPCRQPLQAEVRWLGIDWRLDASALQERVVEIARGEYLELVDGLLQEVRIFSACNVLAFLLMLLATLRRGTGVQHLLPAGLLLVAVLISSYFYLFQQNWFFSILFNDHLGFAYLGYLGLVYLLLADLLLNRARVISWLLNRLLDAVGSSLQVAPC